ncbi:hypothetical protein B0H13DRAFT_1928863 [Mycena leptocephala]|nr:hypothetical protein B0H13DRAFT_1928863 [Mycena leptocephala]
MPESREGTASRKQAQGGFEVAKAAGASFVLEDIAAEATKAEAKRANASKEAKEGLVYLLDPSSAIKRGQSRHQTYVFPPQLRVTAQNPNPPPLSTLVLEKITYTHRALILHFGTLFLMLQYLTHTSVQFYPRERWEKSIRQVNKSVRKFSIGMALIFPAHVLAFPSIDLVFQPTWATSLDDFDIPPNIYTSTVAFFAMVANWIEGILQEPSFGRACDEIRECNAIFYGIGVYTVMELFFMAGLSPFLTLYEVFSVPSRAARFLLAFYSYIDRSENDLGALLQPCIHDGILAPTTEQRLRYADWLYVWAKDRTSIPSRMASLVDEYHGTLDNLAQLDGMWSRSDVELFDVFEPTFLAAGLATKTNLGHLIFGQDSWLSLGGELPKSDDPLTALYRRYGESPTLSSLVRSASIHLSFSLTMSSEGNMRRTVLSSQFMIQGNVVSIGPLEYCGVGHIVHIGGMPHVAVCKGDPEIPILHEKRILRGLDRVSSALDKPGRLKRSRTDKENKSLARKLSHVDMAYERTGKPLEVIEHPEVLAPRAKKRRISADQRLALGCIV